MTEPMELAYEERGSGPVMLFVHGFPFDRTAWIPQLAGLAKMRTCIALDLRGHGLSDVETADDFSMDLFADDVARTLDSMGKDQADLVGHSMGGYVLFSFWRRHRERVRTLTFIDTKAEADTPEGKAGREATAELISSKGMSGLWEGLGPKLFADAADPAVVAKMSVLAERTAPEIGAADALAMRDRADAVSDLAGITVPVLWLHGEQDKLMPLEGARTTAAKIPGARFVAIPAAGHCAAAENPDAVNAAMTDFLKANQPPK